MQFVKKLKSQWPVTPKFWAKKQICKFLATNGNALWDYINMCLNCNHTELDTGYCKMSYFKN